MKELKFNTLAEFKRLAVKGVYLRGYYFGFARGEKNKDEWREIIHTQSNGLKSRTDGVAGGSWFYYPKASECEIEQDENGSVLKIYQERVKYGGNDLWADTSWLKYDIERGAIKESEIERYRKQVAEYRLGVADEK